MLYMNLETGEVLTKEEMLKQFDEEHDGLDPTNGIDLWNYYKEIEEAD